MRKWLNKISSIEEWQDITLILAGIVIILSGWIIDLKLDKIEKCNPDYCYEDFCILLKDK